jgi:hypothetical protein
MLKEFLIKEVSPGNIWKRCGAHGPRIKISATFISLLLSAIQEYNKYRHISTICKEGFIGMIAPDTYLFHYFSWEYHI